MILELRRQNRVLEFAEEANFATVIAREVRPFNVHERSGKGEKGTEAFSLQTSLSV